MENIEVAVRVRPINERERDNNDLDVWTVSSKEMIGITPDKYNILIRLGKI